MIIKLATLTSPATITTTTPLLHSSKNGVHSSPKTALPRVPAPNLGPARRHHSGPRDRRRHLRLGSADPRPRGHTLRRRCFPGRVAVPEGLPAESAGDAVFGRGLASERYLPHLSPPPAFPCRWHGTMNETLIDTRGILGGRNSLPNRPRLHLDPAPTGRRSEPLRARVRALESDTERGEDPDQRDEYVGGAER